MAELRFRLLDEAAQEIDRAFGWYSERSTDAGARFLDQIEHAFAYIVERPMSCPSVSGHGNARRYVLRTFPYDVVYRAFPDLLEVVAIAHHRKRPGYWRRR